MAVSGQSTAGVPGGGLRIPVACAVLVSLLTEEHSYFSIVLDNTISKNVVGIAVTKIDTIFKVF